MSTVTTATVAGELTTTLLPTITRVDTKLEVNSISVILAISIVFILSPLTVSGNSVILVAFYRYKRLRTASNCLLVSLAISDFGVGVFIPFGIHLELSGLPENNVSAFCIAPYCIVIALCSVSVLVTVAIAVDRLTSLAQPLRYKNIITHSSIEKYIAGFWIYAIAIGFSPLIYAQIIGESQFHSENCRFGMAIQPPVRVFLVLAVWAPSALILLGCYMYVYWVARAHARAIYTVELSFRHQTQTLALPRYGQTLAITVGAFFVLWLPFQTCMLLDIFCNTNILSEWTVVWLGLPILAHSAVNPWIYAFHHGEMRIAAGKIAEDLVAIFGVTPSHYGCSPTRRDSNTNLELADVNSYDGRRIPVEDCFAAKQHSNIYASRKCLDMSSKHIDISPGSVNSRSISDNCRQINIIEEDIHDLKKMLDPKYIINRNHMIDSNHNIDKIKNLKYLLDPTFNKIRYLRKLNHKRLNNKNLSNFHEPRFISYQNLKSDATLNRKFHKMNTMSDPVLNADSPAVESTVNAQLNSELCPNSNHYNRRNSNLSSLSDPNIKATTVGNQKLYPTNENIYSVQNFQQNKYNHLCNPCKNVIQCKHSEYHRKLFPWTKSRNIVNKLDSRSPTLDLRFHNSSYVSLPTPTIRSRRNSPMQRLSPHRHVNITTNKLSNFFHPEHIEIQSAMDRSMKFPKIERESEVFVYLESDSVIGSNQSRLTEPSDLMNSLKIPITYSEPSSPIDPLPLNTSRQNNSVKKFADVYNTKSLLEQKIITNLSPIRYSDPEIPSDLLNFENCKHSEVVDEETKFINNIDPEEIAKTLLSERNRDLRLPETTFPEHDSTRYSSRRPSDSKWSESSRSQEILPNIVEYQRLPLSYSVNNFKSCTSGSNFTSCLDPFMCPDALSSSLRESYFSGLSVPNSDTLMSFEETKEQKFSPESVNNSMLVHSSVSTANLSRLKVAELEHQSRSTESVMKYKSCGILRLEPSMHRSRPRIRPCNSYIINGVQLKRNTQNAPLSLPTPTDICTPTFDIVSEIKGENNVGVRV